jgi:hypothetical protein
VRACNAARGAGITTCPDPESLAVLLSAPPLLLACDATSLDYWQASAALAEARTLFAGTMHMQRTTATTTSAATGLWVPQHVVLVGPIKPPHVSRAVQEIVAAVAAEEEERSARREQQQQQQQQQQDGGGMGGERATAAAGAETHLPCAFAAAGVQGCPA